MAAKSAENKDLAAGNEAQAKEKLQVALERKQKEALRDADHLTNQVKLYNI